jgi:hypothetical protein
MNKRLYFELMVELSHKDTWVHYYFVYYKTFVIFSFFEIGPRKRNIILTQLRCFASFLNYDLFQVNIVSDPSCRCGANRVLKCAKKIRHKLNKLMKSSPIYNKLQHYLIEHACI